MKLLDKTIVQWIEKNCYPKVKGRNQTKNVSFLLLKITYPVKKISILLYSEFKSKVLIL